MTSIDTPDGSGETGRPRSAASWALEQILSLIGHGGLSADQNLPPERDLALQIGVSRSSIREATSALIALGLLDSRQGAGVFVTSLNGEQLTAGLRLALGVADSEQRREMAAASALLARQAAADAAKNVDETTLRLLEGLHQEVLAATTPEEAADADDRLHSTIVRSGRNSMLAAIVDALSPVAIRRTIWRTGWTKREALCDDHASLLAALTAGDGEAARTVFASHLLRESRLLEAEPPDVVRAEAPRASRISARPRAGKEPAAAREVAAWHRDAKLGILVHWGLYSIPGWAPLDDSLIELLTDDETESPEGAEGPDPIVVTPFAEWYQNSLAIEGSPVWHYHKATYRNRRYADFAGAFSRAVATFEPDRWADLFAQAGARYVVQVAKHHDGFAMWPPETPNPGRADWFTTRDVVGDVAAAVRSRNMHFGLYYSAGIDWTFANLPIRTMAEATASVPPGIEYAKYVDAQWRELIARYEPSMLWNDMGYPDDADPLELFRDYYSRVPDGVVNDRFNAGTFDVATPNFARRHSIDTRSWSVTRPIGVSYGWNRQETAEHLLSVAENVHLLIDVVSKNGNLLLGVSPDDRGEIPAHQQNALVALGSWLGEYGEAIYGTRPWTHAESVTQDGKPVRFTTAGGDLFVHVLGPCTDQVAVTGLHLASDTTVTLVGPVRSPVTTAPGRLGTVLTLPAAQPQHTVVLRVSPAPAGLVD